MCYMKLKLSFIAALVIAISCLSSCNSDSDNLYGKDKDM